MRKGVFNIILVSISLLVLEYVDVSGYISYVSSPKKSRNNREYFDLMLITDEKDIRGVCYDTDHKVLFDKLMSGNDVIIANYTGKGRYSNNVKPITGFE